MKIKRTIARKYGRIKDDHYIRISQEKGVFRKVDGKKITIKGFEDFDFFARKVMKGKLELWTVSESITGLRVVKYYKNIILAKKATENFLATIDRLTLVRQIHFRVGEMNLPPNFVFVSNPKKLRYVASKTSEDQNLDDALRNRVRVLKK